jgi:predicted DNA-binding transcriptional regulator YafY
MAKKRTDAERRLRQCERLSRLLRVLRCISGPGRWDAEDLARELEVSPRTIHRDLQTLTMAAVPVYYDKECQAYRVRPGFRFPVIQVDPGQECLDVTAFLTTARQVIADAERLVERLRQLCSSLESREQDRS